MTVSVMRMTTTTANATTTSTTTFTMMRMMMILTTTTTTTTTTMMMMMMMMMMSDDDSGDDRDEGKPADNDVNAMVGTLGDAAEGSSCLPPSKEHPPMLVIVAMC